MTNVLIFVEQQSKNKPAGERYSYAEVCDLIFKYISKNPIEIMDADVTHVRLTDDKNI